MLERADLLKRHAELRDLRWIEEPQWREIAMLIKPDERDIGTRNERIRVADEIFDSTGLMALEEFSGGLFNQATNPAERWFNLGLEDKALSKWGPVQTWLWQTAEVIYASVNPSRSGFYVNMPATFADLGAFGLGSLYSAEKPGEKAFVDIAIPLSESFIDTDGQGNVTEFHRSFPRTGRQLKAEFGAAASHIPDERKIWVIHACFKNPEHKLGALGPKGMEWSSVYFSDDDRDFRSTRGYYELPYHSIPWTLRSGRVYPTGIGHIARPDLNMVNEMERSHIVAAQFAAEPPTLLHDQSVLTAADIQPNALLYGTINEDGKPLLQRFSRGEDVKLSLEQSQQRRQAIRDAFKFSLLSILSRPQMTATEFLGWKNMQLQVLAPQLTKIHTYGLAPFVRRRAKMLGRMGLLPPPPPELKGQKVEIDFVSPLAKAQKASQGQATMQFIGAVAQLAQEQAASGQPATAWDKVDTDGAIDVLYDSFGPPPGVLRNPDAVDALRQQRTQAQQGQQGLENAGQVANVAATAAHAMQAATLTGGRIGGPQGSGRPQ